jgi:xylose isomerase
MEVALAANALGSIDANRGDTLLGWDTDQFPSDLYLTTNIMLRVLKMGGFTTGGLNFDAKRRRESHEPADLFHAHVGGMDAFAFGLKAAHRILERGSLDRFVSERYASFDSGMGAKIEKRATSLDELEQYALGIQPPVLHSGRQEMLENIFNSQIFG